MGQEGEGGVGGRGGARGRGLGRRDRVEQEGGVGRRNEGHVL